MDMPRPSNSNDPYLRLGCLRCLIGSLVCRALTNVGCKQCNLMGTPIGNLRRSSHVSVYKMGLLYYLVVVVPSGRLAALILLYYRLHSRSFLCTWPAGQFNIRISPSIQAAHSLIWWSLNRSAQIQAPHQRLPCRCLFRLPRKRSDCDCFFLLLGFTYTSPMLPVRPWNDNGLLIFVGHLKWSLMGSYRIMCTRFNKKLLRLPGFMQRVGHNPAMVRRKPSTSQCWFHLVSPVAASRAES